MLTIYIGGQVVASGASQSGTYSIQPILALVIVLQDPECLGYNLQMYVYRHNIQGKCRVYTYQQRSISTDKQNNGFVPVGVTCTELEATGFDAFYANGLAGHRMGSVRDPA
jgi:hypothetical protein